MITADATFVFYEGSLVKYGTTIAVEYKYSPITEVFTCELIAYSAGADIAVSGNYLTTFTKAEIDAKTGAGTETSDKLLDEVELVVIDYLDGITENAAITFTN